MMKKLIALFSFIFSLVILFSCEPGRDENGDLLFGITNEGQTGGGGTTTGRLLKKMISHEINDDTGEWEDSEISYNYTGSKLISYVDGSGEPTLFTYNSSNKISKLSNSGQTADYEYVGGNVSKITTNISGIGKITATYTYTGAKLTKSVSIQEYSVPLPFKIYLETTYEYQGDNVVKSMLKTGTYLPNGDLEMNPAEDQALTFAYDAKNSPYKLLPKEFIIWLAGIGPQGGAFLSGNNFTKFGVSAGGQSTTENYTYTYDSENFPTEMKGEGEGFTKYEYQ